MAESNPPREIEREQEAGSRPAAVTQAWLADFLIFLREHTAWWLAPLCAAIGLVVLLAWLTREPQRPPTYPFF
jgi:hypothetical protein